MERWTWISKEEMKGEMFSGSSGAMAPMGAQFWSKGVDTLSARLVELTTLKRMDMLLAS
jgi:hypothetical protein